MRTPRFRIVGTAVSNDCYYDDQLVLPDVSVTVIGVSEIARAHY